MEKLEETDYDFGWGAGYLFRDNSKTVIAPTITYQDPVSNGNLVYWYVSDDGEGSANAKQYLPGDVREGGKRHRALSRGGVCQLERCVYEQRQDV